MVSEEDDVTQVEEHSKRTLTRPVCEYRVDDSVALCSKESTRSLVQPHGRRKYNVSDAVLLVDV